MTHVRTAKHGCFQDMTSIDFFSSYIPSGEQEVTNDRVLLLVEYSNVITFIVKCSCIKGSPNSEMAVCVEVDFLCPGVRCTLAETKAKMLLW